MLDIIVSTISHLDPAGLPHLFPSSSLVLPVGDPLLARVSRVYRWSIQVVRSLRYVVV